ncbi:MULTISPECIES: LysM peptidoglycan-binding domain-containing protein [unclassified Modestobacter]|uniref:LysM peptidoglycan-binding domain-containing protein n=1 Tax=unclassified Modestobacter TaxID=2643866 RepID=UPI0022AA6C62|nr:MULTISPECIES: LysM peptidoglycan-binding domain-containing protein [unclassified Modestobacter]MCZ2826793.1 LysM peptidoglycan-binding domain-containing protein [Modestobacter sp. VKM Ac-2981]MCZ2855173.1 LysM peptidoglycan-binding domain-containing protein [Modestobacter sp. VKM Ac-2982]
MAIPQLERPVAAPASMAVVLPFPGAGQVAPSSGPPVQGPPVRLSRAPRPALPVVLRLDVGRDDGCPGRRVGVVDGGSTGRGGRVRQAGGGVSAESGGSAPLRLTRRGRRVIAGLSIAFGVSVAAATIAIESGGAGGGLELAGSATIVVQSGDTLWSIAGEIAPEEDRRAVVDALLDVNGLSDVDLVPGQVLELP